MKFQRGIKVVAGALCLCLFLSSCGDSTTQIEDAGSIVYDENRIRISNFKIDEDEIVFSLDNNTPGKVGIRNTGFAENSHYVGFNVTMWASVGERTEIHTRFLENYPKEVYTGKVFLNITVTNDIGFDIDSFCATIDISNGEIRDVSLGEPVETPEQVDTDTDSNTFRIPHGVLLSAQASDSRLVLKVKITALSTNKTTIDQNYFNIENIIKNQGGDQYTEIQYWAVADMTSGEESKVISFTLDSSTIQMIKNGSIAATQIGDYANDLYILPSLM